MKRTLNVIGIVLAGTIIWFALSQARMKTCLAALEAENRPITEVVLANRSSAGLEGMREAQARLPDTVWKGQAPPFQAPVDTSFPVTISVRASSVKVCLDTRRVPDWNEIDAVELVGREGTRQWATASSTFAEP